MNGIKLMCMLIGLFLAGQVTFGQQNNARCKDLLMACINKAGQINLPKKGDIYYMQMKMKNTFRKDLSYSPADTHLEVLLSDNRLAYESDQVNIYVDTDYVVAVMHQSRTIKISPNDEGIDHVKTLQRKNQMLNLQQNWIKESQIRSCKDAFYEEVKCKQITIKPSKEIFGDTKIEYMSFYLDIDHESLKKVNIHYKGHKSLASQTIEYKEINYNYKKQEPKPAIRYIFDRKGRPLAAYGSYKIIQTEN